MKLFLKDYINYKRGKVKWEYLDFIPSWACQLRCITCNSWRRDKKFIDPGIVEQILRSPHFKHLKTVTVEGGEPTLWPELRYFVFAMLNRGCSVGIVTNGFLTDKIWRLARSLKSYQINWTVSINGLMLLHDQSRGVRGSYDRAVKTIEKLREITDRVGIAYTLFEENQGEYYKVQALGEKLGVPVTVSYPANSARFGEPEWTLPSQRVIETVYNDRLRRYPLFDRWAGEYFQAKVKNKELMPCFGGQSVIHINPDGVIRPCGWWERAELGRITTDGVVLNDVQEVIDRIPQECQYHAGQVCNICPIGYGLRRMMPMIMKWKVGQCLK